LERSSSLSIFAWTSVIAEAANFTAVLALAFKLSMKTNAWRKRSQLSASK
jgi:hypothetical protein